MKKIILLLLPILLLCSCNDKPQLKYKNFDVLTFQPFFDQTNHPSEERYPIPDGIAKYNLLVPAAGDLLVNNIPDNKITFDKTNHCSQNKVLTKEEIKKLGPNQIILFEGHGSLGLMGDDPEQHSIIWTGQYYDHSKEETDQDYYDYNLVADSISGQEAFTFGFIEKYVTDLTGSLVYLGNCYSGREVTLAQTFLKLGAEAVIANSHTIQAHYNSCMEYTTIKYLTILNPETNKTYTLYEALCKAKEIYGKTDQDHYQMAAGSEPMIFGNPNFCLSSFN